ncbi:MAG: virulence RhuM family protein [Sulfuricella sp.]
MGNAHNDKKSEVIIYEIGEGLAGVDVRVEGETVWLTQEQMSLLFERERSVITKHLRNVFKEGELDESSVCANFAHTASDGKSYQTKFFNLDAIISVGYRVNSRRGVQFRQWATRVLREHLVHGLRCIRDGWRSGESPKRSRPSRCWRVP